jgi:uncharacterized membrane protein YgcG
VRQYKFQHPATTRAWVAGKHYRFSAWAQATIIHVDSVIVIVDRLLSNKKFPKAIQAVLMQHKSYVEMSPDVRTAPSTVAQARVQRLANEPSPMVLEMNARVGGGVGGGGGAGGDGGGGGGAGGGLDHSPVGHTHQQMDALHRPCHLDGTAPSSSTTRSGRIRSPIDHLLPSARRRQ